MSLYQAKNSGLLFIAYAGDNSSLPTFELNEGKNCNLTDFAPKAKCGTDEYCLKNMLSSKNGIFGEVESTYDKASTLNFGKGGHNQ